MEYLSRLLKVRTNTLEFNYHPRCEALKITHLAFADDLMLFSRGDLHSVKILIDCLNDFKHASGLDINSFKSSLFTAGVFGEELDRILNLLNFPFGTLPVRYLGVHLAAQKLNVNYYAPIYVRIASYINKWTANSLSYVGRLILIKSVLQGVECFWLQIFPLPNTVIDRINRLCRVFLWGRKTSHIALSKDVHSWNKALLAKILCNIHSKADSLWVRWVHSFYLKNQSIWTWNPKKSNFCLLKRICDIRNELLSTFGSSESAISNLSHFSNSKGLSSSKMYDTFRDHGPKAFWQSAVWKNFIPPPKYSFCVWLAINERLATINNLKYLEVDPTCKLCGNFPETASHLFFDCIVSRILWDRVKKWLKFSHSMSKTGALKWTKKEHANHALKKARVVAICCTIYQIWKARNCQVFEGSNFSDDVCVS
ncbi:hypothetical protein DH2020_026889 [Rehmannia glutinosa]|uniref:Reverse transcriptase domain-containing protein n=1 Tax=Rehmannia glutinosa TaxID=99300 RepID=A0ABR0VYH0_REHGL